MISLIPLLYKSSLYSFESIFVIFCIISIGIIYVVLDNDILKPTLKKGYFGKLNITHLETRMFFLYFSIIILFSEIIQIQFLKNVSFNFISIIIAVISFVIVFTYTRISKKEQIDTILLGLFFAYQIDILVKIYFTGINLIYFGTLIILFFAASIVIKKQALFLFNCFIVFGYLFFLLKINKITYFDFHILFVAILGVMFVSYGKRLSLIYFVKNLEFSKELIENSSALLCAFDKYGNLIYANNAITTVLGYKLNEVKGKQFWVLTQDPDFVEIDYNELYQPDRTYVRKLTSKSGKLRYILWSEKKIHENLFISSGQDITLNYLQQQDYQILFDNLSEIIYELDNQGKFKKINNYAVKVCGYNKNELNDVFFKELVFPDDIIKINEHYRNVSKINLNFKPLEFRILRKDGSYIWVSQIVNTKLNVKGNIVGFTAVARVITEEKELQYKQNISTLKSVEYQNIINDLYTLKLPENDLIGNIKSIIKTINIALQIDRISIWKYTNDGIILEYIDLLNDTQSTLSINDFINKNTFPKYFESMEHYNSLIVNDVELNQWTRELYANYFVPNNVKSLIDHVIRINGTIDRIICFEECYYRDWTEDEIRFTRTIANYLALIIERNEKSKLEHLTSKRGKLLNSINNINSQLIKSSNFLDILNCEYKEIGEILKVSRLFFYENKRGNDNFSLMYKWYNESIAANSGMHSFNNFSINNYPEIQNQFEQVGYFATNSEDLISNEISNLLKSISIKSIILLPLYVKGNLFGFIGLDDDTIIRKWHPNEIELFKSFAKNLEAVLEKLTYLNKIKESEQKFELLANNIPAGIYLLKYNSRKSSKIYFNNHMEQITGYSINDFYENKISLVDLYHPDDKEIAKRAVYHALKERGTYTIKVRIIHKTGKIVNIEEYGGTIVINDKIAYIEGVVIAIPEKEN